MAGGDRKEGRKEGQGERTMLWHCGVNRADGGAGGGRLILDLVIV